MVAVIVKVAGLVALVAVLLHSYYGDRVAFPPSSTQKGSIDGPFGREAALLGALQKALRTRHPLPLFIGAQPTSLSFESIEWRTLQKSTFSFSPTRGG